MSPFLWTGFILTLAQGIANTPIKDEISSDSSMRIKGLFEGDIVGVEISPDRNAIINADQLWPNAEVPYEISEDLVPMTGHILKAMAHYLRQTCIKFRPKTQKDKDYVSFEKQNGCTSPIGRQGGKQIVSLGNGCYHEITIAHEIGHALGFWHEHSRSDRDDYVTIYWKNITEGESHNFVKLDYLRNNFLDESFDYLSIMMYEGNAFSIDPKLNTIEAKQPGIELLPTFKKTQFSPIDVRKFNKLYQCFGMKRPEPPLPPPVICNFKNDNCGMENQPNMGLYFERKNTTLAGRTGSFLMLESSNFLNWAGRLITPYYESYTRPTACFSFDAFIFGPALSVLDVTAQDSNDNRGVGQIFTTDQVWKTFNFDLKNVTQHGTRFFLTAQFHTSYAGLIAFDNFRWSVNSCDF